MATLASRINDLAARIRNEFNTVKTLIGQKQANLGFTPVQQGGGSGQTSDKVYLGWNGSTVAVQVNSTNFGGITWLSDFNTEKTKRKNNAQVLRGNYACGGSLSFVNGYVFWDSRIIQMGDNKGTEGIQNTTYTNFECPTSGSIDVVGTTAVTATASGIPIPAWGALYYDLASSGNAAFHIVPFVTANYAIPDTWVLIGMRCEDGNIFIFACLGGIPIRTGETYNMQGTPLTCYSTSQQTVNSIVVYQGNSGSILTNNLSQRLEVRGAGGSTDSAYMAFHRPGQFAALFGLDTDNNWYVGGWSYGANRYRIYKQGDAVGYGTATITGDITATGNITSSYSDELLKVKTGRIPRPLAGVLGLTVFKYRPSAKALELGIEDEEDVGLSAQEVQRILPEAVKPSPMNPEYLTIRYERLVPLLVAAMQELARDLPKFRD